MVAQARTKVVFQGSFLEEGDWPDGHFRLIRISDSPGKFVAEKREVDALGDPSWKPVPSLTKKLTSYAYWGQLQDE